MLDSYLDECVWHSYFRNDVFYSLWHLRQNSLLATKEFLTSGLVCISINVQGQIFFQLNTSERLISSIDPNFLVFMSLWNMNFII